MWCNALFQVRVVADYLKVQIEVTRQRLTGKWAITATLDILTKEEEHTKKYTVVRTQASMLHPLTMIVKVLRYSFSLKGLASHLVSNWGWNFLKIHPVTFIAPP